MHNLRKRSKRSSESSSFAEEVTKPSQQRASISNYSPSNFVTKYRQTHTKSTQTSGSFSDDSVLDFPQQPVQREKSRAILKASRKKRNSSVRFSADTPGKRQSTNTHGRPSITSNASSDSRASNTSRNTNDEEYRLLYEEASKKPLPSSDEDEWWMNPQITPTASPSPVKQTLNRKAEEKRNEQQTKSGSRDSREVKFDKYTISSNKNDLNNSFASTNYQQNTRNVIKSLPSERIKTMDEDLREILESRRQYCAPSSSSSSENEPEFEPEPPKSLPRLSEPSKTIKESVYDRKKPTRQSDITVILNKALDKMVAKNPDIISTRKY